MDSVTTVPLAQPDRTEFGNLVFRERGGLWEEGIVIIVWVVSFCFAVMGFIFLSALSATSAFANIFGSKIVVIIVLTACAFTLLENMRWNYRARYFLFGYHAYRYEPGNAARFHSIFMESMSIFPADIKEVVELDTHYKITMKDGTVRRFMFQKAPLSVYMELVGNLPHAAMAVRQGTATAVQFHESEVRIVDVRRLFAQLNIPYTVRAFETSKGAYFLVFFGCGIIFIPAILLTIYGAFAISLWFILAGIAITIAGSYITRANYLSLRHRASALRDGRGGRLYTIFGFFKIRQM